jgi:hypothetical protein
MRYPPRGTTTLRTMSCEGTNFSSTVEERPLRAA